MTLQAINGVIHVSATADYTSSTFNNVSGIEFDNTSPATATFDVLQFGTGAIPANWNVFGSPGTVSDNIVVQGGSFNASSWQFGETFLPWDDTVDTITLKGGGTTDIVTGSVKADSIIGNAGDDFLTGGTGDDTLKGGKGEDFLNGGSGADILRGGENNDWFYYQDYSDLAAHEVIDGGHGKTDVVALNPTGPTPILFNFAEVSIKDVEQLLFQTDARADFSATQIGRASGLLTVTGSSGVDTVVITGQTVDISNVTFDSWSVNTGPLADIVTIDGTKTGDSLIGSSQIESLFGNRGNDLISGGGGGDKIWGEAGADTLVGGGGNDIFYIGKSAEIAAGEAFDSGTGNDEIVLANANTAQTYSLRDVPILHIEVLALSVGANPAAPDKVIISDTQIGAGAMNTVKVTASDATLKVIGSAIDLSAVTFDMLGSAASLAVKLEGTSGDDNISGGNLDDEITGGLGSDDLAGGGGADSFIYETLDDTPTGATRDRIGDFTQGDDVIVIGMPGFTFIAGNAFSASGSAEIGYELSGVSTILNLDGDGDGIAEAKIALTGTFTIDSTDLILL